MNRSMCMTCAWCGSQRNVVRFEQNNTTYIEKHRNFCFRGSCAQKYTQFCAGWRWSAENSGYVYLRNGIPFCYTGKHPEESVNSRVLECDYCGKRCRKSVVKNIFMPRKYEHNTFCKNDECIRSYITYVDSPQKLSPIPHGITHQLTSIIIGK